jgi:hypothetical protein
MSTGSGKRYAVRFLFFKFDLEFLTEVESFNALNAKIHQITNGFGGRQV